MTFDELIAAEIRNTLDERCGEYMAADKGHCFSVAYRIKKRGVIRSAERGNKYKSRLSVRRVRYLVLAVLLALFVLMGFSVWLTVSQFLFNVHQDHSVVYITPDGDAKTSIEEIYGLPDDLGYEVTSHSESESNVITHYCLGEQKVMLRQTTNWDRYYLNTEYGMPEPITVNGNDGYFIQIEDEFIMGWTADGYRFSFSGNIDKTEALKLVELIKIK